MVNGLQLYIHSNGLEFKRSLSFWWHFVDALPAIFEELESVLLHIAHIG
jgi:hypothetical protein